MLKFNRLLTITLLVFPALFLSHLTGAKQTTTKPKPEWMKDTLLGIKPDNPKSSFAGLGKKRVIQIFRQFKMKYAPPWRYWLFNRDKTERLELHFHGGNERYTFSAFRVTANRGSRHEYHETLPKIANFKTKKGVHIGMSQKKLIKILGIGYKSRKFGSYTLFIYRTKNYPLSYYECIFSNQRLIEYSFGTDVP